MAQFNPTDTITLDVPLFIRLLEYAREDAKTDMDLHKVTENILALSEEGNTLTMDQYDEIVKNSQPMDEIKRMQQLAGLTNENLMMNYDGEGNYDYEEGPGATPEEIQAKVNYFLNNRYKWDYVSKEDFEALAQGEKADIKTTYYPTWKKEDFQTVIDKVQ